MHGKPYINAQAGKLTDENSFDNPHRIVTQTATVSINGSQFEYTFPKFSFTILRMKTR